MAWGYVRLNGPGFVSAKARAKLGAARRAQMPVKRRVRTATMASQSPAATRREHPRLLPHDQIPSDRAGSGFPNKTTATSPAASSHTVGSVNTRSSSSMPVETKKNGMNSMRPTNSTRARTDSCSRKDRFRQMPAKKAPMIFSVPISSASEASSCRRAASGSGRRLLASGRELRRQVRASWSRSPAARSPAPPYDPAAADTAAARAAARLGRLRGSTRDRKFTTRYLGSAAAARGPRCRARGQ
jgi:hypothetical protein